MESLLLWNFSHSIDSPFNPIRTRLFFSHPIYAFKIHYLGKAESSSSAWHGSRKMLKLDPGDMTARLLMSA